MTKLLLASIAISFSINLFAADAPSGFRIIESSPEFVESLTQRYPAELRKITADTMVVPANFIEQLAHESFAKTGHCGGFLDITGEGRRDVLITAKEPLPALGAKRDWIVSLLTEVRASNIRDFVLAYSNRFSTRAANSSEGQQAAVWLRDTWQKMATDAGRRDIKVDLIPPPQDLKQNSVRITIPGKNQGAPIVVLGAHLDSISRSGNAPGADDDGSGISALTETFRVMLASRARPNRTIQLFGYAGEELGLRGSRMIAQQYQKSAVQVRAVLQLDMVAWPGRSRAMTFITDNVDAALTLWTKQLYGLYVGGAVQEERCGYGCSDHASWNRYGYPAVLPFESLTGEMNNRIHTSRDVWDDLLDADYAAHFVKVALAFAAELSI